MKTKEARQEIIKVTIDEYIALWDKVINSAKTSYQRDRLADRANQQVLSMLVPRGSDSYWQ